MRSEKAYAILLYLYPVAFRQEYGRDMCTAFRRRLRDETGLAGRCLLWLSVISDTLVTASGEHLNMLIQDIRYSLRSLRTAPAFTIPALMTFALGIGATTAIYSLVYAVLLRPLPFTEPDRLVRISETNVRLHIPDFSSSVLNFLSWQDQTRSFEALAAIGNRSANLTGDGEPQRVLGAAVSANFWHLTGIGLIAGRGFAGEEDVPGNDKVAILSERLWQQRYGGDPAIVGRTILVNSVPRMVVGIAPQDAGYTSRIDLWTPLAPIPAEEERADHEITVLGRLRPGVTIAQADAELNSVAEQLERQYPKSNSGWRVRLTSIKDWIVGDSRKSLYVMMAAAGLLLLGACANVAALVVTRASARSHEFGVRLALGAGQARIVRQLGTESLVLAFGGGALGILLALGSVRWLATRITDQLPRSTNLALDWPVLLFAVALTVAAGLAFGLLPSWSTRRGDVMMALRKAGRGTAGSSGALLRSGLVGGQVAVATVLVVVALLLIQSLAHLQKTELGFRPDHVLTATINLPTAQYPTQEKAEAFYRAVLSEIDALPGVVSAGITSGVPMSGVNTSMPVMPVEKQPGVPEQGIQASWRMATEDYFRALGIPLLRGRLFDAGDTKSPGIILSEDLVRRLWHDGASPVGRQVRLGNGIVFTVVGIVGDVKLTDVREEGPAAAMYFQPFFMSALTLTIRTTVDPAHLTSAVRNAVRRVDPAQPVSNVRTMDVIVESNIERSRLQTTLLAVFASLALLLGAIGVAGVVAYTVERRTPELAVRLALGATPGQALQIAARAGLIASLSGLASGLLGARALSETLSALLYKVRPDDPTTFASVGTALFAVSIGACWLTARRATRIDPATALKQE